MQAKHPTHLLNDDLEQIRLDQEDQAVVDLAFEEAVDAIINQTCQHISHHSTCLDTKNHISLTNATTATEISQHVDLVTHQLNTTSINLSNTDINPNKQQSIATNTSITTNKIDTNNTTLNTATKKPAITGFLAEVFTPEIIAKVNKSCHHKKHNSNTATQHNNINSNSSNNYDKQTQNYNPTDNHNYLCCDIAEEVTLDQLQQELNSISGQQTLHHTKENDLTLVEEDPVFSYHLYNRSSSHHPCEHDLQTYDPCQDTIEITMCKDHLYYMNKKDGTSNQYLENSHNCCYELDLAHDEEFLAFLNCEDPDFLEQFALSQQLEPLESPVELITELPIVPIQSITATTIILHHDNVITEQNTTKEQQHSSTINNCDSNTQHKSNKCSN